MECPTDIYLVQSVRIQQTADLIRATLYSDVAEDVSGVGQTIPIDIYSLETKVHNVGNTLRLDLPQSGPYHPASHPSSLLTCHTQLVVYT